MTNFKPRNIKEDYINQYIATFSKQLKEEENMTDEEVKAEAEYSYENNENTLDNVQYMEEEKGARYSDEDFAELVFDLGNQL